VGVVQRSSLSAWTTASVQTSSHIGDHTPSQFLKGTVSMFYLVDNMKIFLLLSGHYENFLPVSMLNVRALLLCLGEVYFEA
jgi:hypothetical protein